MKAILVIDLPEQISTDDILIDFCVHTRNEHKFIIKGGNHEMKPMPNRIEVCGEWISDEYQKGWNACIESIKGDGK